MTICAYDRKCLFGEIIDDNMELNDSGEMVDKILRTLPGYYQGISIDNYIAMPNHIHAIIIIKQPVGAAPCGRPLINTGLQSNNISNKNNIPNNGQAQGPVPMGLSLSDIIYRF